MIVQEKASHSIGRGILGNYLTSTWQRTDPASFGSKEAEVASVLRSRHRGQNATRRVSRMHSWLGQDSDYRAGEETAGRVSRIRMPLQNR